MHARKDRRFGDYEVFLKSCELPKLPVHACRIGLPLFELCGCVTSAWRRARTAKGINYSMFATLVDKWVPCAPGCPGDRPHTRSYTLDSAHARARARTHALLSVRTSESAHVRAQTARVQMRSCAQQSAHTYRGSSCRHHQGRFQC
eukprot:6209222-Pleurochrysis_carterae.AAC.2